DIADALAVAARHAFEKIAELVLAGFAPALVDVVVHVIGQQRQHAVPVGLVEAVVIAQHQRRGAVGSAGTLRDHVVANPSRPERFCSGAGGTAANSYSDYQAKRSESRSTLPPERMTPIFWPANRARFP